MAIATLYEWLFLLHIVAAMVWVGGTVTLGALATYVGRSRDAEAIRRFVGSLRVLGPLVLAPAMLAVLAFGIWLVVDTDAWSIGQTWVWLALVLFGGAFVVGAGFQSRAAIGALRAVEAGDTQRAEQLLVRWTWGIGVILALLLAIAWDMVFKPGL
jgi:uncharacterized membrane protein